MSIHVFGAFVTGLGTAANNRGDSEGSNVTPLQKLLWENRVHTTVSAEAIRFALRKHLSPEECNRKYDEDKRANTWVDPRFSSWGEKAKGKPYADDDLLGFMVAEGASAERGTDKGSAKVRRAVLEVARAVSLTPWSGDVTFNAASPGATPSAQKGKGVNPVPYATEMHATRYQYGIAMTPSRLVVPSRAVTALQALCALGEVAGNHGRFLFDFSPDSAIFRITSDPAPRILYAFTAGEDHVVRIPEVLRKVRAGDIKASELVIGGAVSETLSEGERTALRDAVIEAGVLAACDAACKKIGGKGER